MDILLFWLPGRVAGPEVGPGRKWQGLGPALSIAGAATGHWREATDILACTRRKNEKVGAYDMNDSLPLHSDVENHPARLPSRRPISWLEIPQVESSG